MRSGNMRGVNMNGYTPISTNSNTLNTSEDTPMRTRYKHPMLIALGCTLLLFLGGITLVGIDYMGGGVDGPKLHNHGRVKTLFTVPVRVVPTNKTSIDKTPPTSKTPVHKIHPTPPITYKTTKSGIPHGITSPWSLSIVGVVTRVGTTGYSHYALWGVESGKGYVVVRVGTENIVCVCSGSLPISAEVGVRMQVTGIKKGIVPATMEELWVECIMVPK